MDCGNNYVLIMGLSGLFYYLFRGIYQTIKVIVQYCLMCNHHHAKLVTACDLYSAVVYGLSLQNHTVERVWVEVNTRMNYPIKYALIQMMENHEIDTENPHHKFVCRGCPLEQQMLEPNYLFSLGTITLFLVSVMYLFRCPHSLIYSFCSYTKGKINSSRCVPVIRMRDRRIRTVLI